MKTGTNCKDKLKYFYFGEFKEHVNKYLFIGLFIFLLLIDVSLNFLI